MRKYFDYAATTPMDEEALEAYMHAVKHYFGNTSSLHDCGTKAQSLVEHCRRKVASLLGVEKEGVYFTCGGTESNEIALDALVREARGRHIITSEAEHSSVINLLKKYEKEGYAVTKIPLTAFGKVDVSQFKDAVRKETAVAVIQHVNSDIGTVQPVRDIGEFCRERGILFHCDGVQSFGKLSLEEVVPYVDSFSLSGHKIYGPKGVGAVYIRSSHSFLPRIPGSSHESGVRPGTVNTPGIAGMTVAAEKMAEGLGNHQRQILSLKETFLSEMEGWERIGDAATTAVPIVGLCSSEREGQWVMLEGNRHGFHFSTGSACGVQSSQPPATLLSMGKTEEEARSFIRISFSHHQTVADVKKLAGFLTSLLKGVGKV